MCVHLPLLLVLVLHPLQVEAVPLAGMFGLCVAFLGISFICQVRQAEGLGLVFGDG
jgi:hypothetical protein